MLDVCIYARVSSTEQDTARQIADLKQFAQRKDYNVVKIYSDTITGKSSKRQARNLLMEDAKKGKFKAVLMTEVSRWGRNSIGNLLTLHQLAECGVSVLTINGLSLDLSTMVGRITATVLSEVAQWELEKNNERVRSGVQNAKLRGVKFGRKEGFTNKIKRLIPQIKKFRLEGKTYKWIAKEFHIDQRTVAKVCKEKT